MLVIAYYSGLSGLAITDCNDYEIKFYSGLFGGPKKDHHARIYYNSVGEPYFKYHGYRVYLNECLRTDL